MLVFFPHKSFLSISRIKVLKNASCSLLAWVSIAWFYPSLFPKTVGKRFLYFPSYLESSLKDLRAIIKKIATSRYNLKYYIECLQVTQKVFIGNTN